MLLVAVTATLIVAFFTIDLGRFFPYVRADAERWVSRQIDRPMHIGRVSAMITPGRFAIDDVLIEGRTPTDRPFFKADRIYVHIPWWRLLNRKLDIEVDIVDWEMVIESWEGNVHNVPRFKGPEPSDDPKRFDTTVRFAYAKRGHFIYEDHATPWSIVAPNLEFSLVRADNLGRYVGVVGFSGGTVQIQQYEPMRADLRSRFELDGGRVRIEHADLITDGAESHINGDLDLGRWPEQTYNISSTMDFRRMRELFFAHESWELDGEGEFAGVFRYFNDGRELAGEFRSDRARVNELEFLNLHGALIWTRDRFAVTHAESNLLGGHTRFQYGLAPLGTPGGSTATFSADYTGVDLFDLDRLMSLRGMRLAGLASGSIDMAWPNGRFSAGRRGRGHTVLTPSAAVELAPTELPALPRPPAFEPEPFEPYRRATALAVGGDLHYRFDADGTTFDDSWAATPWTYVAFAGVLSGDGAATFPFQVTSHDWQESDRLLAAIMSAVGGPTRAVEVQGRGTFAGEMTGTFSSPRVTGRFYGESVHVWDVTWGTAVADIVIEGGYVDIANSRITSGPDAAVVPEGRFALGFREDGAEEIAAHVMFTNWPMEDLKTAFGLEEWSMDGTVGVAELNLHGQYREMFGSGHVRIDRGVAWGEGFESARADVELEGDGMLIRALEMRKGPSLIHGSARVGWNGTYAFNADGEGVPVERLDNLSFEETPLTGRLRFTASGAGDFESPSYTFDGSVADLFIGDEGIGAVTGRLSVANDVMTIERVLATSSRLVARMTGTIGLDEQWTSDLDLRFQETSLDPYLKFILENDISPYTRIVVAGALGVRGPLGTPEALTVEATIDESTLTLFDYDLSNDGPVELSMRDGALRIGALQLRGSDTNLSLTGGANTRTRTVDMTATGDASLAILQLFFEGVTASGAAILNANLTGSLDDPQLTGQAVIADGRLRPLASPHSLEAINGTISFGADGARLEALRGRIASGDVSLGGTMAFDGSELNLTATGRSMRLRYPAGFSSTADMDLFLSGSLADARLTGSVDVLRVSYLGQVDTNAGLLGFSGDLETDAGPLGPLAPARDGAIALTLDLQVSAPRMTVIDTRNARIEGRADMQVRGTFDQPQLSGTVEILGGEYLFNGNRYFVRESFIDFTDPTAATPFFDVAAETRARSSGQTFTINVRITGTLGRLDLQLTSDPWLPDSDIVTLLFGGAPNLGTAEQRALGSSQEMQQRMVQTAGATLLTSPLTSRVGAVLEGTGALDTVQITPLLSSETAFQQLNPSARITLGKRISPRVFLTYSRTLNAAQEEIILLEYDQNDRLSWVLSRNEDRTFALDFRLRYVF
jgi:hypothetical protein